MTRLLVECQLAPHADSDRLTVRNGFDLADVDAVYREAYATRCWLNSGAGVPVEFGHHGKQIGEVVIVAACGAWHRASLVIDTEDPEVLERIRPGVGVSLDAWLLRSDTNPLSRTRWHKLAKLNAVAITRKGDRARVPDAKIVRVTESRTAPRATAAASSGWRSKLPAEFADWATFDMPDELERGAVLINHTRTGERSIRWTGATFTAGGRIPMAA